MLSPAEFRTGLVSLPETEADEVPSCCFDCPDLQSKGFSTSDDASYLYCSYNYVDGSARIPPPCQQLSYDL
jgi:hypothetical protein